MERKLPILQNTEMNVSRKVDTKKTLKRVLVKK